MTWQLGEFSAGGMFLGFLEGFHAFLVTMSNGFLHKLCTLGVLLSWWSVVQGLFKGLMLWTSLWSFSEKAYPPLLCFASLTTLKFFASICALGCNHVSWWSVQGFMLGNSWRVHVFLSFPVEGVVKFLFWFLSLSKIDHVTNLQLKNEEIVDLPSP
jgi:hypothetical protein